MATCPAVTVELPSGSVVRVASLRSLVVLKIAAYLDRARERDNDLEDIAHILSEYVGSAADERRGDEILDIGMDFDDVSPFVLGKELGALVDEAERRLVQKFVAMIEDPEDRLSTLQRIAERAPAAWKDPARLRLPMIAFHRGFESSSR